MNERMHGAMSDQTVRSTPPATTTHAERGAGHPRLLITNEPERMTYELVDEVTTIGSSPTCTLTLPDMESLHATITHDDRDEYVVTLHGEGEMNANPTSSATAPGDNTETLRHGAHFTAGAWRFVFQRDEYADHGRPFGGRVGGELSDQPPQPKRPDYSDGTTQPRAGWEVQDD
ncbi:FHA domain-containing protein [Microbacterium sp. NC79]|uniref:FHA domain-containing protein n=1 Tax=Microbacterium sp. NC79 TaxID=2851009 RepID=UPI0020B6AD97|nr:FHA domain-containing protein [Microbacterium sp. NC79]